jgi:hypothetical protein
MTVSVSEALVTWRILVFIVKGLGGRGTYPQIIFGRFGELIDVILNLASSKGNLSLYCFPPFLCCKLA